MKTGLFACCLVLTLTIVLQACAGNKEMSSGNKYATLLETVSQRTLPGRRESKPETRYSFTLVWHHQDQPLGFFWNDGSVWRSCDITIKGENRLFTEVNPGDTLVLSPSIVTEESISSRIPTHIRNHVIAFKTKKSGWRYLPVTEVHRKPDIVMP